MKYLLSAFFILITGCTASQLSTSHYQIGSCVEGTNVWVITDVGQYSYKARRYDHPEITDIFPFKDMDDKNRYVQVDCY